MPDEQTHDEREQRRDGRGRDRVRVEELEQLNVRRDDGDEVAAVEPRFPSEKVREIDLRERAPELVIARTRLAHQQIVAYRTLEEVALVADVVMRRIRLAFSMLRSSAPPIATEPV